MFCGVSNELSGSAQRHEKRQELSLRYGSYSYGTVGSTVFKSSSVNTWSVFSDH